MPSTPSTYLGRNPWTTKFSSPTKIFHPISCSTAQHNTSQQNAQLIRMDPNEIVRQTKEDLERRQALWEDVADNLKVDLAKNNTSLVSKSRQLRTLLKETEKKHEGGTDKAKMVTGK